MSETHLRTVGDHLAEARRALSPHSETPSLDSQLLMMKTLGVTRAWVLAHAEADLTSVQSDAFVYDLSRVVSGTALPYVIGSWEFFGRPFVITPDVLIPRPETEILVTAALRWLSERPQGQRVVDVGCGSGCIAISLALDMPGHMIYGVDVSPAALAVARRNAEAYHIEDELTLVEGDLLTPFDSRFDLVCANLPYIPTDRLAELEVAMREPSLALDGGPDGLAGIERLGLQLASRLAPGGRVLLELDPEQMDRASALMRAALPGVTTSVLADLSGRDRVLVVDWDDDR
ncbi:MAG: peptide chain release factor N(5)-glutamine methyltransferase [Anaerolineales bacterium]